MDLVSLNQVLEYIKNGNNLGEPITLVGATKTMPVEDINLAIENGLQVVAENKVQEFVNSKVTQDILVEVNIGGELSKSGFNPDNLVWAVNELSNLPNVKVKGLMAMLPHTDDQVLLKELCVKMRTLYDNIKKQGLQLEYLSIGMSADWKIAVANGSNMIRLGSTIFGKRNYTEK